MTCEFLDDLWLRAAGRPEHARMPSLAVLRHSEWSAEFETLMRNRLIVGAFRYGLLCAPDKPKWDRMSSAERRVKLYRETGNKEYLVDIANLALVEFVKGDGTLKPIDDGKEHVTL